jgi:hypothetical protein
MKLWRDVAWLLLIAVGSCTRTEVLPVGELPQRVAGEAAGTPAAGPALLTSPAASATVNSALPQPSAAGSAGASGLPAPIAGTIASPAAGAAGPPRRLDAGIWPSRDDDDDDDDDGDDDDDDDDAGPDADS